MSATVEPTSFRLAPRPDNPEILDDRSLDFRLVWRSMRDVALANRLFGGTRAVIREFERVLPGLLRTATLLDVGSGAGDIAAAVRRRARQRGVRLFTVGVETTPAMAAATRDRLDAMIVADAAALPFRDRAVDVVTCSQLLHHFAGNEVRTILTEANRVARRCVIVSDIRRTPLAAIGLWLASFVLRFHPISRHDGVASVRRGYRTEELRSLVLGALGAAPTVRRHRGFRVTASWPPL